MRLFPEFMVRMLSTKTVQDWTEMYVVTRWSTNRIQRHVLKRVPRGHEIPAVARCKSDCQKFLNSDDGKSIDYNFSFFNFQ